MRKFILLLVCAPILLACSQKDMYQALQYNQQADCEKLPQSQYEACMDQNLVPYEDYSEQREQLISQ